MLPRRLSTWPGHALGAVLGLAAVVGATLPLHAQSAPGSLPRLQVSLELIGCALYDVARRK